MATKPKHRPGPPMTLGNMRTLGVQRLVATCLNDACRHKATSNRCGDRCRFADLIRRNVLENCRKISMGINEVALI